MAPKFTSVYLSSGFCWEPAVVSRLWSGPHCCCTTIPPSPETSALLESSLPLRHYWLTDWPTVAPAKVAAVAGERSLHQRHDQTTSTPAIDRSSTRSLLPLLLWLCWAADNLHLQAKRRTDAERKHRLTAKRRQQSVGWEENERSGEWGPKQRCLLFRRRCWRSEQPSPLVAARELVRYRCS